jgi:hypothetical protein|tara:strand:- start:1369 stop:2163 length:795 start_codon:yes stop_codon:yes gene_type:complete
MQLLLTLPNKKEVVVEEILYKDLRKFCLYNNLTIADTIDYLETFIVTKNLNVMEKFLSLLLLRQQCIGETISISSNRGPIDIEINYILKNIGDIEDRVKTIKVGNVKYELSLPTQFNCGDSDFVFSLIRSIEVDNEKITLSEVTKEEYAEILNTLPKTLYSDLTNFVDESETFFNFKFIEGRESLDIAEIRLNVLSQEFSHFILNLFNVISGNDYRQMIFTLCRRMKDISFLVNCTFVEIEDYYRLYKEEVDQENKSLQKQNIN